MRGVRPTVLTLLSLLAFAATAGAATPVFDPAGTSFYDLPFPYELRRDADGTISVAGFPQPSPLAAQFLEVAEEAPGFGLTSGVFFKLDGPLDPSTLPSAAESVEPDATVFLVDVDPRSANRGRRIPLWCEFRETGDAYRDDHLLALVPVAGHVLDADTLYAAVLTDGLRDAAGVALQPSPFVTRMAAETPTTAFESASLPLFAKLWAQLEGREGLGREGVVGATVFRTGDPTAGMVATEKWIRHHGPYRARDVVLDVARSEGAHWLLHGRLSAPQFQAGDPPFNAAGSGGFVFDRRGRPVPQRTESLRFVMTVPKETADGRKRMPRGGWPVVAFAHGTGGSRWTARTSGIAAELAAIGVASFAIDLPLHGLRDGATADGSGFFNVLNPLALRDNPRQAAADQLVVHRLLRGLVIPAAVFDAPAGAGFARPDRRVRFDRRRRLFMGHSLGALTGPLFLGVARGVPGGVLSAASAHSILGVLTRQESLFGGFTLKQLIELLLGGPVDLFHPALHLIHLVGEPSDPIVYAPAFASGRFARPQSLLLTHGLLDEFVTTPMTASLAVAGRYPLVAPVFPAQTFPHLPGYDYAEAFRLAGLEVEAAPVSGNLSGRTRTATGGLALYEDEGHFAVVQSPVAVSQWTEFMRSLAHDGIPTIPAR